MYQHVPFTASICLHQPASAIFGQAAAGTKAISEMWPWTRAPSTNCATMDPKRIQTWRRCVVLFYAVLCCSAAFFRFWYSKYFSFLIKTYQNCKSGSGMQWSIFLLLFWSLDHGNMISIWSAYDQHMAVSGVIPRQGQRGHPGQTAAGMQKRGCPTWKALRTVSNWWHSGFEASRNG